MMRLLNAVGFVAGSAILTAAAASAGGVDASKLMLSAPAQIVELDTARLKGDLFRLSWSPDGRELYLQTAERDSAGQVKKVHHYLLGLVGKAPKGLDAEPAWSTAYWTWKSGQAAPRLPTFKISLEQQQKRMAATAVPNGGDLAKGGIDAGGPPVTTNDAAAAAFQSQMVSVITLTLKGDVIAEFVNAPLVPGLTWGWAPAGTGLVAFADQKGSVQIMDNEGRKQEIDAKSALLPAWSDDGTRLAFLDRTGRNKAVLRIVDVKRPE